MNRLRGTYTIARALPGQRRMPFLPPEQLARVRDQRVRALIAFAAEHVPHYRDLFRREGIAPREIASAEDLARLPLLDKAELQATPERFLPRPTPSDCVILRTAGSTGEPVGVVRDPRSLLESIAYDERERAVESHLCGKRWRYQVAYAANPGGSIHRVRELHGRASFRPFRPRVHMLSIFDPPEVTLAELDRIRPLVIRGHGSYIEFLFRTAAEKGVAVRGPRVVNYGADHMSDEGRRLIEDRFGIPVISKYGAAEATKIGFFCERRTGFHMHEDLTHISLLTADGRSAEPGESGEVVVTDLVNRGTVLINYRLGDLGVWAPDACGCGRTTRVLRALQGRANAFISLADGTTVHPMLIELPIRRHQAVLRFQLIQVARDRFELLLVTNDERSFHRIAEPIADLLRDLFHGATVSVERRESLLTHGRAKFRSVVALGDSA